MAKLVSTNPSDNYKQVGSVKISTENDVKQVVIKARKTFVSWGILSVKERIAQLQRIYDKLYKHKNEISKLVSSEMGFPIKDQKIFDIGDGFNYFKWYLENAEDILSDKVTYEDEKEIHKVVYEPYGVVAVIQPWNFPFCQW